MWKITQDPWHGKTYSKELRIWPESVNQFHSLLQKATPSWKWKFLAVGLWGIYAHIFSVVGINSYNMRKNHPDLRWFDLEMIQRWRLCHCILTFSWGWHSEQRYSAGQHGVHTTKGEQPGTCVLPCDAMLLNSVGLMYLMYFLLGILLT